MTQLTTARLLLRRPDENDLDAFAAMNADPEVMRYIGDGSVLPPERAAAGIARARQEWDERGHGLLSVVVRETGRTAGWVALAVPAFLPEVLPAVEIGWRFGRPHWGHGYATEAARRLLRFGFTECGLDRVVSIRHVDNDRSRRVMDKLGLRFAFETVVPAHGRPVAVHEITEAEHRALRDVSSAPAVQMEDERRAHGGDGGGRDE
ncbi:GNAT family N-acetyltransferase [Nonomuraea spiralis]|uniref:GNAT family N-acetyltransferase n=1 Tax=Nonomuraea TaxID=83681 RepID=UPI000F77F0EA|nr:GNAT family N-acetyltransferase [Nonomuraea sp. WAC 01424]RSM95238.1 GNAT family N-acetyltransferase [Nonomuraea sp. WAC 01424]